MSNTRLIYTSKENAEVSNDDEGSFTNSVDDGIVVKVGDEISVEQIAINSIGVGAEIIEIPKTIKNYKYKTNAMMLNCAYYIQHNQHPFTIMMPLNGHNSVNTTATDKAYGYMIQGAGFPPTLPMSNTKTKWGRSTQQVGSRFYLGAYIFNNQVNDGDPLKPETNPIQAGQNEGAVPSVGVFQFARANMIFEVDTGYDNPANIANKITQDFHAGNATPQISLFDENGGALEAYGFPAINNVPFTGDPVAQGAVHSKDTACVNIFSNFLQFTNTTDFSLYQNVMGFQNPFYAYYGSRLLCDNTNLGGTGSKAQGVLNAQGATNTLDNSLFTLSDFDSAGGNTAVPVNCLYEFNLPYNYYNVKLLADFIHSQKQTDTNADTTTSGLETTPFKQNTFSFVNVGRVDDASTKRQTLTALDPPTGIPAGTAQHNNQYKVATFFDDQRYGKVFLSQQALTYPFTIRKNSTLQLPDGRVVDNKTLCRDVLDCMILPVDTGGELVCALVSNGFNSTGLYPRFNYALVDLGFFNSNNPVCAVLADTLVKDGTPNTNIGSYANTIQVGSPEFNMVFDETRGRFALENMSWANYIDNGTSQTANPSAGNTAVAINYLPSTDYGDVDFPQSPATTKYAQSGIGILDISVLDENYNAILIDYEDANDIKEKYNNSLLARLGFSYRQLTNRFGKPDSIFTQRCYETNRPVKGVANFPYPLTNNLRFDTSLDLGLGCNDNNLPMFNLSNSRGFNREISAVSDRCYALSLPKKLENPFWLIKSDIIDGADFSSEKTGGGKQNVLAVCNRAYLAGDFAFAFSTNYAFKATKEFVLTGVKTQILNPDLTPADIDIATTIIYKVVSPIPFFEAQAEEKAEELEKKKK